MALADTFNSLSTVAENNQQTVINEIISYFRNYIHSNEFLTDLEKYVKTYPEYIEKRQLLLKISFWKYQSGCSDTNFRAGLYVWHNPEHPTGWESEDYKGVRLFDIQERVCKGVYSVFANRLEDEGFMVSSVRQDDWMGNYTQTVNIRW